MLNLLAQAVPETAKCVSEERNYVTTRFTGAIQLSIVLAACLPDEWLLMR